MTPRDAYLCFVCFHGVVAAAKLAGVEEHAQDLYVVLRSNPGDDDAHDEKPDSTEQGMKQGEDRSSRDQSDEEQSPLCSQDSQRPVHGLEDFVGTTFR